MLKNIVGVITGIAGFLGAIGSVIAMKYWMIVLVIMTILKLTGVVAMPWFAGILSAGAISTGLWMLFGGFHLSDVLMLLVRYIYGGHFLFDAWMSFV